MLFGQYRKGDANDPQTYVASIAAILAEYPAETIRHVTDPRTGIAGNPRPDPGTGRVWTGMPNPGDVKLACEDHYGITRRLLEREAQTRWQLAERDQLKITDRRERKTYAQLQAKCAEAGIFIGNAQKPFDAKAFRESHGLTQEQWDAIPDAKPREEAA